MGKVRLTLVKSGIGQKQDQKDTLRALGLRKMGHSVEKEDSPTVRGMVHKVRHMVELKEL